MSSVDQSNQLSPNSPLYYAPRHFRDRANDPAAMRRLTDLRKRDTPRHALTASGVDGETGWQNPDEFTETEVAMKSERGPMSKLLVAAVLVTATAGFTFWIVPDIVEVQSELSNANRGGTSLAVIQSAAADVASALKPEPVRLVENGIAAGNEPLPLRIKLAAVAPEAASQTVGMAKTEPLNREAVAIADAEASVARKMSPDEVAALIKRGQELATDGDFPAARLLLQRAAEAHEPRAALALAATYDPVVIKRFTLTGAAPDTTLAEAWYQKAREWDSSSGFKTGNGLASVGGR
jgi:hypothetical protein